MITKYSPKQIKQLIEVTNGIDLTYCQSPHLYDTLTQIGVAYNNNGCCGKLFVNPLNNRLYGIYRNTNAIDLF